MTKPDTEDKLLHIKKLNLAVNKNVQRIKQRIKEGRIIQVADFNIKRKTFTTILNFLKTDCKFQNDNYTGLYLFFNKKEMELNETGFYTGISRNLAVRLKDHVSGSDPSVASFAVLIARNTNQEINEYLTLNAYKSAKTEEQKAEKKKQKNKLKAMVDGVQKKEINELFITAIPISNYQELHATEPFIASAFQCQYNSFKTH